LNMIQELAKKDKGGRGFTGYQVNPTIAGSVGTRLQHLSKGERVSLFQSPASATSIEQTNLRQCSSCRSLITSPTAHFCERCGEALKTKCKNCNSENDSEHDYCIECGSKMS